MRTPNPPTGFSLSQICRQRPPAATAGLYNQKLTHLRLLIDLPLLLEARPQPSITYRSLRDSYKADRDTNAQNSAGTNYRLSSDQRAMQSSARKINSQLSVTVHTGTVYQTLTGAHHVGGPCDGPLDRCRVLSLRVGAQRPWSNKYLPKFRISCQSFWRWKYQRSARNWRALGGNGILPHSPIKPNGRWPGQKGGACRMEPARAEPKLFESEEPHARKPRNEMALNPLKTNDPAKS